MLSKAFASLLVAAAVVQGQTGARTFDGFRPGACGWVPRMVSHFAHRDQPDTSAFDPRRDTLDLQVRDSVRVCQSVYGSTVNRWETLEQARVQLIVGEDAAARATANNYFASIADSGAERAAWALYLNINDMLSLRPARIAAATEAVAKLDKMGSKAARASVLAHSSLAQAARQRWDDTTARAEASSVIAQWRTLTPDAALAMSQTAYAAFAQKAELALRVNGGDAVRAVIDTAQRSMPSAAVAATRQLAMLARLYSVVGRKAAPIEAAYWFRVSDSASTRPHPGKVFIISEASHACGAPCRTRYQSLGRLVARFGKRGLEVINTTKTLGFIRDTAAIAPVDEAKYDSSFFFGQRQIPGSLAVYETKYRWLTDGRRVNERTPQEQNYPGATFTLVDKTGSIRYVALGWDPVMEEPLARLIEKLLADNSRAMSP